MHTQATGFLAARGLSADAVDVDATLARFRYEMARGLAGEPLSLPMIPAHIGIDRPVPVDKPAIVLDAGGTNLRAALVSFDASGRPRMDKFKKVPMPGAQGAHATAQTFYAALVELLAPLLPEADDIGFCFSYPAETTPECDARLMCWTKNIDIPDMVGTRVGGGLAAALKAAGRGEKRITVLNDTVATLLAGKSAGISRRYSNYVGLILGTGSNTAYVAPHSTILKIPGLAPGGAMAINVESGGFAGIPQTEFDRVFDATTTNPGAYTFEKMIAGAYLGGVGLAVFQAAAREGFFSPPAARALLDCAGLPNMDFDEFCANPFTDFGALARMPFDDNDRRAAMALGRPVFERAAVLAAVNIAAAVLQTGEGADPLHPVAVTIDGSTYYRTKAVNLKSLVEQHLRHILGRREIHFELLQVEDAPVIGAAVAGLTR